MILQIGSEVVKIYDKKEVVGTVILKEKWDLIIVDTEL